MVYGRHGVARNVSAFSGCNSNFHDKATFQHSTARSTHSAVCVIRARAFCVWSTDDMVLLETVRPFPAATRTSTTRLRSDTAQHGRRTVLYVRTKLGHSMCGLWATWCCSKQFGLFRLPREVSRNDYFLTGDLRCLVLCELKQHVQSPDGPHTIT